MISLITMGQGNPQALLRTVESVKGICDEVIFGDVCVLKEDSDRIINQEYPIPFRQVYLPFTTIYERGFSSILNTLSIFANYNICIYLNVGEVFESSIAPVRQTIFSNPGKDCFFIDHATEKHRWFRVWDKRTMYWDGLIHEEIRSYTKDSQPYHKPLFRFGDTEKDLDSDFKARVMNDVKEIVYFTLLMRLADNPNLLGGTDPGWLNFAHEQYQVNKERLDKKGKRIEAFQTRNLEMYLDDIHNNPEFQKEVYESSIKIEFQGDKKFLLP